MLLITASNESMSKDKGEPSPTFQCTTPSPHHTQSLSPFPLLSELISLISPIFNSLFFQTWAPFSKSLFLLQLNYNVLVLYHIIDQKKKEIGGDRKGDMVGANFMDEMDCGSFFDHIDDLLEFPNDDVENVLVGKGSGCDEFSLIWPENSLDSELPGSECVFSGANNCASNLSAELSVPYEDIIHLEWLSTFVEDSFSGGGLTLEKSQSSSSTTTTTTKQSQSFQNQFQSSSPISVLESSSNCTTTTNNINNRKRARSKRPRPTAFTTRLAIHVTSSESESSLHPHKKKQKIKFLPPLNNQNQNQNPNPNPPSHSQAVRKCMHCEITKTPQWRAGPMGPKTLCNACGVRYKSGRLFPEYRPAASPTFVPALHSNSHKKVVEMRSKNNGDNSEMPM